MADRISNKSRSQIKLGDVAKIQKSLTGENLLKQGKQGFQKVLVKL